MQKNRNLTFKSSFEFSKEFLQSLPSLDKLQQNAHDDTIRNCAFEKEFKVTKTQTRSNSFDRDSLTNESDLDIISFGKSSSSSISWSEDFDSEATVKVQHELERMERILCGEEAIPSNYNKDEYKQWIETFPNIRIIKNTIGSPVRQLEKLDNLLQGSCQHVESPKNCNLYSRPYILEPLNVSLTSGKSNLKNVDNTNNLKELLKVSPIFLEESGCRSSYLNTRQQPSRSTSRSEKLSRKWIRGDAQREYSSLPYVSSAKNKINNIATRKKNDKFKHTSTVSPYRSNCVSLPPIKTISFPSANRYRPPTPKMPDTFSSSATIPFEVKMKSRYLYKGSNCDSELITLRKFHK